VVSEAGALSVERSETVDDGEPQRRGYANLIGASHRVAAAAGVVFLVLAVLWSRRLVLAYGDLGIASGSNDLMTFMLFVLGFVFALSYALLRPGRRNTAGARATALVWTGALLLALGFTWYVIVVADRWTQTTGTPIASPQEMDAFLAAHPETLARYDYRVPTGTFLQSFEFLNSNNVEMTGYVWQFYSDDIPDSVPRGVVFPEALEEAYKATEAWRIERDGGEEIGWYFSGTFRQNFDYRLYPFDRQDVWLRLWHPDPARNVLLVPDFAGYTDLTPAALPGVEKDFVYGGWDPIRSGFSYGLVTYNMNFGLDDFVELNGTPLLNLYFNLSVERDFLGPMLEHGILELAIAILLFFLLLLIAKERDDQERLGLTVFDLIVAAGGLLFAVILDLNAIRGGIESQQLTYLEWFPLILITFVVLVVLNAVLRAQEWRLPYLGYTGDLVPVLAYWPALLGTLLVVTLLVFFY
jgi:hypothetical protein